MSLHSTDSGLNSSAPTQGTTDKSNILEKQYTFPNVGDHPGFSEVAITLQPEQTNAENIRSFMLFNNREQALTSSASSTISIPQNSSMDGRTNLQDPVQKISVLEDKLQAVTDEVTTRHPSEGKDLNVLFKSGRTENSLTNRDGLVLDGVSKFIQMVQESTPVRSSSKNTILEGTVVAPTPTSSRNISLARNSGDVHIDFNNAPTHFSKIQTSVSLSPDGEQPVYEASVTEKAIFFVASSQRPNPGSTFITEFIQPPIPVTLTSPVYEATTTGNTGTDTSAIDIPVDSCGGILRETKGKFQSPGFPQSYQSDMDCIWVIEVPVGYHVVLDFHSLVLEEHRTCQYDYVIVYGGQDNRKELGRFCGPEVPPQLQAKSSVMTVIMRSDSSVELDGFLAHFSTVKPSQGSVTLTGGRNRFEGLVEVEYGGQRGGICAKQWSYRDALVVCRQLGYLGAAVATSSGVLCSPEECRCPGVWRLHYRSRWRGPGGRAFPSCV
nr:PREDICTED: deleted in malignant brain tumors 1 protein-like [Latimeria chalumnae]|eukprot:XP_014352023.1 PREDICTED: deleted in malignant brain tumors 1 protein-like [Latimeria chalumnae]